MQQGDQFYLMFEIKQGNTSLAPEDVTGIKAKVGDIECEYPGGDLTYDSGLDVWLFPLTQEDTLAMYPYVKAQVQVNFGGDPPQILGTEVSDVYVSRSIIQDVWDE